MLALQESTSFHGVQPKTYLHLPLLLSIWQAPHGPIKIKLARPAFSSDHLSMVLHYIGFFDKSK
jgi:hypothetical protein